MIEEWKDVEECKGWEVSNRGVVKKKHGTIKTAKVPVKKGHAKYYYSFMKGSQKKYIEVSTLVNKYFPKLLLTAIQIEKLRNEIVKVRPPSAFKKNIKSLKNESNIRRCATCGKPTTQYRCSECWQNLRERNDYLGGSEDPYSALLPTKRW